MHLIDGAIIGLFIAYSILTGFRSKSLASRNLEEYFLAGRSLKGWQAGLSMAATQFSADTPLLVMGMIATAGLFGLWQLWIYALSFLLMAFMFAPQWRRAKVLTDAQLTELRYGRRPAEALRLIKAFYFGTFLNCIVLAWVLFAAARIAEPFLLWDQWLSPQIFKPLARLAESVGITVTALPADHPEIWRKTAANMISLFAIVLVTALYSTTGGLRSVVKTDIVQFGLMMGGTLLFSILVVKEVGGLSALHQKIGTLFGSGESEKLSALQVVALTPWDAKDASFSLLTLFAVQWIIQLSSDGTGYLAQRAMACRSDQDARIAALVFTFAQVLVRSLLWIPLGLGLLVLFPPDFTLPKEIFAADREASYVRGIAELLPPGIKGIMVTAMLAALASTLDTHLNWGSSYWTNDIYKRFICQAWLKKEPRPRTLVLVARVSNFLILALALIVMTQLTSIQKAWQTSLLMGAGVGPVLVLRWIWWRINAWSEIGGMLAALAVGPFAILHISDMASRLLFVAGVSVLVAVALAFLKGPENSSLLKAFYERVRPAGFWGPFAPSGGTKDRQRLYRALIATGTSAFSLFCALVGIGSWLAGSPAPNWWPSSLTWDLTLIGISLALIPVWWRVGLRAEN